MALTPSTDAPSRGTASPLRNSRSSSTSPFSSRRRRLCRNTKVCYKSECAGLTVAFPSKGQDASSPSQPIRQAVGHRKMNELNFVIPFRRNLWHIGVVPPPRVFGSLQHSRAAEHTWPTPPDSLTTSLQRTFISPSTVSHTPTVQRPAHLCAPTPGGLRNEGQPVRS